MNRLYAVESVPTLTGAMADHRLSLRASEVELFARAVAAELGIANVQAGKVGKGSEYTKWITALVRDLQGTPRHQSRCCWRLSSRQSYMRLRMQ